MPWTAQGPAPEKAVVVGPAHVRVEQQLPLPGLETLFFLKTAATLLHGFKAAAVGIHLGETLGSP